MQQPARPRPTSVETFVNSTDRLPASAFGFISVWGFQQTNSAIFVLNANGVIIATLTGNGLSYPAGMATSNSPRKLYVANEAPNNIAVYTSRGAPSFLSNGKDTIEPLDVAVDGKGYVAAANYGGNVTCFAPGATSATSTIYGGFDVLGGDAFDAAGNLYVVGTKGFSAATQVGEIIGGCAHGTTITALTTANTFYSYQPSGLRVESDGRIAISEYSRAGNTTIFAYNPPRGHSLGTPVTVTYLAGLFNGFAFTPGSHAVLTAGGQVVTLYAFPSGLQIKTVNLDGFATGAATSPSEQY